MRLCLGIRRGNSDHATAGGTPVSNPGQSRRRPPPHLPQEEWQFYVSPYIWIPGVNLNINALRASTSTNIPWWDIASRLFSHAIGVMGRAEAWKGRWGLYFDGYYTYLGGSDSQVGATRTQSLGPVNFTIDKPVHLGDATFRLNIPGQASGTISLTPSGSASYISRVGSLDMGGRYLVGTRSWQPDREFPGSFPGNPGGSQVQLLQPVSQDQLQRGQGRPGQRRLPQIFLVG